MNEDISANTTFSHYRVVAKIGAGGMGEVYRAHDSRLEREVALKVLPSDLSNDVDRLRRFEQEAKATSALNHPNILTVYDIGEHEGSPFIVAELLDGEELRQRLDEGPMPLRKAIEYAQQIVSGLSAAHEKGIVHRDLKPENLFITKDDRVKILDFGLAKLRERELKSHGSEDATRKAMTDPGIVMGTAGYMSPEQVRGQAVDHRSDIFSFGAILYEMLTGNRAFHGDSVVEMMNAILKEDVPELEESGARVPPALDKLMRRCLEKKPEHRFHSAHDLGFALEAVTSPTSSSGSSLTSAATSAVAESRRSVWRERIPWIAAGVLLLGLIAALPVAIRHVREPKISESLVTSFLIEPPEKSTGFNQIAISPDGRNIVYITTLDGKSQLWLRPLNSFTARPLAGTDGANGFPFWSADGRSIAFQTSGNKMKKVDLADGTVQVLWDRNPNDIRGFDGTWSRDGTMLFFNGGTGILRLPATGGEPTVLPGYEPSQDRIDRWPRFLPDGRHFLFLSTDNTQARSEVFVGSVENAERKRILTADANAMYLGSADGVGYLLFVRDGALLAQRFDPNAHTLAGDPFRVSDSIRVNSNSRAYVSVSENGTLVYDPSNEGEKRQLTWFDRTGKQVGTLGQEGINSRVKLSPDQKYALISRREEGAFLYNLDVLDTVRGASSRLNADDQLPTEAIWSPDGNYVAWSIRKGTTWFLMRKLASGAGQAEVLLESKIAIVPTDWSADGKFILYTSLDITTKRDLWVLPLEGDRTPFLYFATPAEERSAMFSPDGRFVAYQSSESGRDEVYVQTFPASAGKWPISPNVGLNPRWRKDGKELFYVQGDGKLMSVEIKGSTGFDPGTPKPLFDTAMARSQPAGDYVVSLDGERFLFLSRLTETGLSPLAVVVNWTADPKK